MKPIDRSLTDGILFTDLYQLTMAQLYFRAGLHEQHAQFDYFFRNYPDYGSHQAGYCISAGLEWLVEWMQKERITAREVSALKEIRTRGGTRLFENDFLQWLEQEGHFGGLSMLAVPEGRVVHPNVPVAVVHGPLAMAQLLESALLNHLNYQTLIATKATRIRSAGCDNMIIDFGLRRAQGKGADAGSRAALIGGADFSSNVGLSLALGLPPKGTHGHSMVQAFMATGRGEEDAFRAYAEIYPDDCVLLVDTINTLESGIPNAIRVFEELKRKGHEPVGIRLDSGDLAYLSIQAAKMLDAAGFGNVAIVLSNELDEMILWQITSQIRNEAAGSGVDPDNLIRRLVYGVGTRLMVSDGAPALDGVYKLTAMKEGKEWVPAIKISESPAKTINPGFKKVWRVYDRRDIAIVDLIGLEGEHFSPDADIFARHPTQEHTTRTIKKNQISAVEALHADIIKEGRVVFDFPEIAGIRRVRQDDLRRLDAGVKRLINPDEYHVSLSGKLWDLKRELIRKQQK